MIAGYAARRRAGVASRRRAARSQTTRRSTRWQATKGLAVAGVLLVAFLFAPTGRARSWRSAGAGVLLLSRKLHSRDMLGLVDWQLLVLFVGLFVVNHALAEHRR